MKQKYAAPYQWTAYYNSSPQSETPEASFHHIQTIKANSLNKQEDNMHIQPLWLRTQLDAQVHQFDCEVDSGARCNIMPLYIYGLLFRDKKPEPPIVFINGYGDYQGKNQGSWTAVHLTWCQAPQKAVY